MRKFTTRPLIQGLHEGVHLNPPHAHGKNFSYERFISTFPGAAAADFQTKKSPRGSSEA
jgi:hypothetical protein